MFFSFKEDLLHYLWKYQLFRTPDLKTKSGKSLHIIRQGIMQSNAGPDFIQAKIQIDQITLAGTIEVHVKETEWKQHRHHLDSAYNNVVLHVVWESRNDYTFLENQQAVEILELHDIVDAQLLARYATLMNSGVEVPCAKLYRDIDASLLQLFFQTLSVQRLERKVIAILELHQQINSNWNQVVFILLARYLGSNVNNEMLQQLAFSIPVHVLYKNFDQPAIIEALLFGQSGLLQSHYADPYPVSLYREYQYQKRLHGLEEMNASSWKYGRLRPASFPNIRIAQLAAMVTNGKWSIEQIVAIDSFETFKRLVRVPVNAYWNTHYDFDKERSEIKVPIVGEDTVVSLYINFLVPLVFAYGKATDNGLLCEHALGLLEHIPFEKNKVTSAFSFLNIERKCATESQALIALKTNYCAVGRCLDCAIGNEILKGR
ncbi:MAG: DUF2851 family protein [Chitinophagales bacterium]|nr:DUF2851 family protein [Chitinophagales bacterium]